MITTIPISIPKVKVRTRTTLPQPQSQSQSQSQSQPVVLRKDLPPPTSIKELQRYHQTRTSLTQKLSHQKPPGQARGRSSDAPPHLYTSPTVPYLIIPRWIANMAPEAERCAVLTAAIIVGSHTDGHLVQVPQTSFHIREKDHETIYRHLPWFTEEESVRIWAFAQEANASTYNTALRTALSVGLKLEGCYTGQCLPSLNRLTLSVQEWMELLMQAGVPPARTVNLPCNAEQYMRPYDAGDLTHIQTLGDVTYVTE